MEIEIYLAIAAVLIFAAGILVGYFQAISNLKKEAAIIRDVVLRGLEDYKEPKKVKETMHIWRQL